jgi:hypothetical protein
MKDSKKMKAIDKRKKIAFFLPDINNPTAKTKTPRVMSISTFNTKCDTPELDQREEARWIKRGR